MAKVQLDEGRAIVKDYPRGIEITIPAKKNYFLILFLMFWLVGWGVGEVSAIGELLSAASKAPILFLLAWLGGWTVGGAFAIVTWLYNVKGKEILRVGGMELEHIRDFVLFKRSREYELAHIKELRVSPVATSLFNRRSGMEFWGLTGGTIAFDYGHSTYKLGTGLDEAEAKYIIATLQRRYGSLRSPAD